MSDLNRFWSKSRWRDIWEGESRPSQGITKLLWIAVRLLLSSWLWGTGVRLAHFSPPTKSAGLVLALLSIFIFLWAMWGIWQTLLYLGLKRVLLLFVILFLLMVTINVLTIPDERPLSKRLMAQVELTFERINGNLSNWGKSLIEAPDEFLFAYSGRRRLPELPAGFPTPDPQATPVQAFGSPSGE